MSPRARADITVPSLDGALVSPLGAPGEITVLMFVTTDCPIANRYAPEIRRIYEEFDDKVTFWLVYVSDHGQASELTDHHDSFAFPMQGVRDLNNALVQVTGLGTRQGELQFRSTLSKIGYVHIYSCATPGTEKREKLEFAISTNGLACMHVNFRSICS